MSIVVGEILPALHAFLGLELRHALAEEPVLIAADLAADQPSSCWRMVLHGVAAGAFQRQQEQPGRHVHIYAGIYIQVDIEDANTW